MSTTKEVDIVIKWKDEASGTLNSVAKNSSSFADTVKKNLNKIKIASAAVTTWLVALGKKFIDASIENEPLQKSFERLSESAWIASKDMLDAMRKASKWTVADTNLMASANKAYALWIVKNTEDMATMIEVARLKWQAMWRTMEEALDDITTWLWRWSAQILDNLWIVVKAEEANEKYAQSIGKTVKELTAEEKKQALVNAVIEQGKKELAEAWDVQLTMQEKIARLNTARENTKNTIWDALIPVLDKLLTKLQPIIEKVVDWIEKNPELTANILLWVTAIGALMTALTTLAPMLTTVIALLSWPAWRVVAIWAVIAWLQLLDSKLKTSDEKVADYRKQLEDLHAEYEAWLIETNLYQAKVKELTDKIELAEAEHRTLWGYLKDEFIDTLHSVLHPIETWKEISQWLSEVTWELLAKFWSRGMELANNVIPKVQSLVSWLKSLREMLSNLWANISSTVSWVVDSAKSRANKQINSVKKLAWYAEGWSVTWNVPIVVGEQWPEVFVPRSNWTIIPNDKIVNNNNWVTVNMSWITIREEADIWKLADEIIRQTKLEKNYWIIS